MTAAQLDALPAQAAPDTRAQLLEAKDHLAQAFALVEAAAPALQELERSAALSLRADIAHAIRAAGALATFAEHTGAGR